MMMRAMGSSATTERVITKVQQKPVDLEPYHFLKNT